jgi:hypothetical protein
MNTQTTEPTPVTDFKGRSICFYHPSSKGSGSAMRLEPRLNRADHDRYNCFFLEMAAQKTPVRREAGRLTPATFDWSSKITVKLNFMDIAEMLTVLEGRTPKVGGDRNGLYHASGGGNTLISFQRHAESGVFYLAVSCKRRDDIEPRKIGIALNEAEAVGLRCILQTGLFYVSFPGLVRDTGRRVSPMLSSPIREVA